MQSLQLPSSATGNTPASASDSVPWTIGQLQAVPVHTHPLIRQLSWVLPLEDNWQVHRLWSQYAFNPQPFVGGAQVVNVGVMIVVLVEVGVGVLLVPELINLQVHRAESQILSIPQPTVGGLQIVVWL